MLDQGNKVANGIKFANVDFKIDSPGLCGCTQSNHKDAFKWKREAIGGQSDVV